MSFQAYKPLYMQHTQRFSVIDWPLVFFVQIVEELVSECITSRNTKSRVVDEHCLQMKTLYIHIMYFHLYSFFSILDCTLPSSIYPTSYIRFSKPCTLLQVLLVSSYTSLLYSDG